MAFYNVIKIKDKRKNEDDTFLMKITKEKQNSVTIMISEDGKGTFFPAKLKLEWESFE